MKLLFRTKNFRCFPNLEIRDLHQFNLVSGMNGVGKTSLLEAMWIHDGYFNPQLPYKADVVRGLDATRRDEFMWDLFAGFQPDAVIELESQDKSGETKALTIRFEEAGESRVSVVAGTDGKTPHAVAPMNDTESHESTQSLEPRLVFEYQSSSGEVAQAAAYAEADGLRLEYAKGVKAPTSVYLGARHDEGFGTLSDRLGRVAQTKGDQDIVKILRLIEPDLEDLRVYPLAGQPMIFGDVGMRRLVPLPVLATAYGAC